MMDEFERILDYSRMESTNSMWNKLNLNSKWSVGCVSELIQSKTWKNKEEWEEFYYKSGGERRALIGDHNDILDNFTMDYRQHMAQPERYKQVNYYYGRTEDDLMEKAKVLFNAVKNNGYGLTLDECYECVRFRTICQTWNGIILAESKCISILSRVFPDLAFSKVDGDIDYEFEVDYEVKKDGKPILGLQIKPSSYFGNSSYLLEARRINALKFKAYKEKTGLDVQMVIYYSKSQEYITNLHEIKSKISNL